MTQYKRYRFNFIIKNERGLNRIVKFLVKQNIAHHHLRISKSWAVDSYTGEKIHEKPLHEIMFWHDCKSKSDTTLKIHKLITKKFPKLIQFGISEPQPKPRFKKMNNCPNCNSDNTTFATECYEDDHHEMIEDFLMCLDCEYDERYE